MGFAMPVGDWLRGPLRPLVEDCVAGPSPGHDLFDSQIVRDLWRQHASGWRDRSMELWALLILNRWHRSFAGGTRG